MTERLDSQLPGKEQERQTVEWTISWLRKLTDNDRYLTLRQHLGKTVRLVFDQKDVEAEIQRSQFRTRDGRIYYLLILRAGKLRLEIDRHLDIVVTEKQFEDFPLKPTGGHTRVPIPLGTILEALITRNPNFSPREGLKFRKIILPLPAQEVATPAK